MGFDGETRDWFRARMARALRIERVGGRYHVTARGNERKAIFRDDTDRFHLLGLLGELGERFGARVHAYVLMEDHYHLPRRRPVAGAAGDPKRSRLEQLRIEIARG